MQKRPFVLRNNQGTSFIEVLVALGIVTLVAVMVFPFFANQRKVISNYEPTGLCQGYLARAAARLSSGGDFATESPEFANFAVSLSAPTDWKNVPDIFYAPDAKPVSFNPANTRTFADRFNEMGVPAIGGKHRLYSTRMGPVNYRRADGKTVPAEADGALLYTPLLIKGAVADVADLYNNPTYHGTFGVAPTYIQGGEGSLDSRYNMEIQLQVDRILVSDKSVQQTDNKFWPVPRNEFGNTNPADTDKYRISTPEDLWAQRQPTPGRYFAVAQIPQASDGIEMSWDYGFKVSFKGHLTEVATGNVIDCNNSQDFFLPTDFHNVVSYKSDFDFLTPPSANPSIPQTVLTSELSTKFYDTAPLQSVSTALPTAIQTNYTSMVADPTFLAVFAGTNFGVDASGAPNIRYGNKRPECSQDGLKSKTFELRLRFKNLNKEPGALPLCMDNSTRPDVVADGGADYLYCPGAPGAELVIKNDFLPSQTGFVPCEKMRFCGQIPEQVKVTTLNGDIEYRYQYTIRNDRNNSGNRLWGCDIAYTTAIVDPSGNLSYIPSTDAFQTTDSQLGIGRPLLATITPKIHFKPPPCYTCKCKPAKSGKNPFLTLLLVVGFAAALFVGVPLAWEALSTINFAGEVVGSLVASGVAGVALTAVATCMFQATGAIGGACSPSPNPRDQQGDYRACRSMDKTPSCSNGYTCDNVGSPKSSFWDTDLPTGITDKSAMGYCSYETETHTTNGFQWIVQKGGRTDSGVIDSSAVLNFSDPNLKLNPGSAYVPIDGVSSYTMLDTARGKYCYIQYKCTWNGSHGVWVLDSGTVDGAAGTPYEACWDIKVGYAMDFHPDGTATKGAPSCLKVETDPDEMQLKNCTWLNRACYNGANHFSLSALSLNFGSYTNIAGHATGGSAGTFTTPPPISSSYVTVEKRAAHCILTPKIECGTSPCPTAPLSGLYSPGDGNTYERNDSCPPDPVPSDTSYLTPLLACDASCTPNNSSYGTCTLDTSTTPATCQAHPATFYQKQFYKFDSWYGCEVPSGVKYHMRNATSGMLCFEPLSGGDASLPLCSEGGGITSQKKPDIICPSDTSGSLCL